MPYKIGRVKLGSTQLYVNDNFRNYGVTAAGRVYSFLTNKYLRGRKGSDKRHLYTLLDNNKKRVSITRSRLVYSAVLGPIPPHYVINHIDHDCTNDHVDNLQMVTQSANMILCAIHNVKRRRLSGIEVTKIRSLYNNGKSKHTQRSLAKRFDVHRRTIQKIVQGKSHQKN